MTAEEHASGRPIEILLVEDNPDDIELTLEALEASKVRNRLHVERNGEAAMAFLRSSLEDGGPPRPDVVLLDINLPRKSGLEVLKDMKEHKDLRNVPVVVLTTSRAEEDVVKAYDLQASCYVTKPVDFDQFLHVVRSIDSFWFSIVEYPPQPSHDNA